MDDFLQLLKYNKDIALVIDDLLVALTRSSFPARHLRESFLAMRNITDLKLNPPATAPPTIFSGVVFPNLVLFKSNLVHSKIVGFLALHTTLRFLMLAPCGRTSQCPLNDVDLGHIIEFEGPVQCLPFVVTESITRLTVNGMGLKALPSSILASIPSCPELDSLTFNGLPYDPALSSVLAKFAPALRRLKIVEKGALVSSYCLY